MRRQAAREKLRTLVAPLVTGDQGGQAGVAALGPIRPRISISFQVWLPALRVMQILSLSKASLDSSAESR